MIAPQNIANTYREHIQAPEPVMKKFLTQFATNEDGAITVDWVVLTAAMVALAILLIGLIETGALDRITQMWADVDTAIDGIGS